MGLDDSLGEDTRVLSVEEQVDAGELNVLRCAVPVAAKLASVLVVGVDEDRAPVATPVLVLAEALAGNGRERTVWLGPKADPLLRQSAVVFGIIERFQREPISGGWLWVPVIDSLFWTKKELLLVNLRPYIKSLINQNQRH